MTVNELFEFYIKRKMGVKATKIQPSIEEKKEGVRTSEKYSLSEPSSGHSKPTHD